MEETRNSKKQIALPLVLGLGLAAGVFIGVSLGGKSITRQSGSDMEKLHEVMGLIQNEYVDKAKTDALVEDAIQHILNKLDPHSTYISASDRVAANEDLRGNYEGIGVEFSIFQDTLVVIAPLSGGPSEAVGINAGDKIIKVDDKSIAGIGLTNTQVFKLLKGPKGTEVDLEILRRNSGILKFTLLRDKIPQFSVDASYMIDKEIGYIKVSRFATTTYEEFATGLKKLKELGMKKLIIDLQGNPGGYMNEATEIADEFLPKGQKIVFTDGQDKGFNTEILSTAEGGFEKGDLIILVNEGSASASEILAGALQDNDRALIVGRRSFGKGLVQHPFGLRDGSELRLTISRYYTPSGRSIQKPYGKGENYSSEIAMRFKRGEFFHSDSIKFNDSLRYKTTSGRSVYGGGGIMPDYFVPLDTSFMSPLLNSMITSNSFQEYTFSFAEDHKSELEKMGFEQFYSQFMVSEAMLEALRQVARRNNVKINLGDFEQNKPAFRTYVKAQIARRLWRNDGFFPIFNETNEILEQAVKLFDKVPVPSKSEM